MYRLVNPIVAHTKDQQGHTIWYCFCTQYIPRIIKSGNTSAHNTLGPLAECFLQNKCLEFYDSESSVQVQLTQGLLTEAALQASVSPQA